MLWKFSFASGSTLDTLLSRETPPSVEELLDEQDILAECKAQNNKLVTYLSREESVKSLLSWVTSGLDELDEAAAEAENDAYAKALESKDAYPPFKRIRRGKKRESVGKSVAGDDEEEEGDDDEGAEVADKEEVDRGNNLPDALGIGLGEGLAGPEEGSSCDTNRARYPQVAAEILTSELWTIPETIMNHKETLLKSFWDAVVPPLDPKKERPLRERTERARAKLLFWTDEDEERDRKREVIRGMWMRVNASILQKRTTEMIRYIQSIPDIVERMMAHIESPAVQDMLTRIVLTEENVPDVMSWLGEQRLIPRLLEMLSPQHPPSTHAIVTELLKGIISVSAPNSSFNPHGGNAGDQTGQNGTGHKDNRLVRELTNYESIDTLFGYMLYSDSVTDKDWKGINGDGPGTHRSDPFVIQPLPSVASATSSLSYVCNVIVEIIRRNNSDLAEPYLFNTMRNRLMAIQSEALQSTEDIAPDEVPDAENEEQRKKLEDALPQLADKLAIVHLGNLVATISDRFGELHHMLVEPRSQDRVKSPLTLKPLTMERFRIIELYAELLHSSNMATLNRVPGTGPDYNDAGALTGGIDGLDRLGQALQAGETGEEEPAADTPEAQVTQAKELPVSSGSTDYSLTESDDVPLSDDDTPSPQTSPQATPTATLSDTTPPAPSPEDAERLRNVLDDKESDRTPPAVVSSEALPADAALSTGERLKQQFIRHRVLPTLLDLFFEHSNNNFLHHLVYDILQQILNGQLGKGYNRELIIDLFANARLVHRVLEAQRLNDATVNSTPRKPRLSYMGHISLIAEELVKFFARCPEDLAKLIHETYPQDQWDAFVDGSLRETRAKDSQPLAGGKPHPGLGGGMGSQSERSDSESDDDDDTAATIGEPLSRTNAKQNDAYHDAADDDPEADGAMERFWRPSNARSAGLDSSDDDDDDADWLRPNANRERDDEDDDFGTFQTSAKDDFDNDDAWGSFTSVNADSGSAENPFGDDAFAPSSGVDSFRPVETLTPRDWAEAFDREFDSNEPQPWAEDADEAPAIVMPEGDDDGTEIDVVTTPTSSWSFPGNESDDLGEDLPPTDTTELDKTARDVAAINLGAGTARIRSPNGSPQHEAEEEQRDDMLERATSAAQPFGPGIAQDTHIEGGMLERTMPDGSVVRVPEDDIVRGVEDAIERRLDDSSGSASEEDDRKEEARK